MQKDHFIIGVHLTDRVKSATPIQEVLTEYGCNIKTRLGLHEDMPNVCSPTGLILIDFAGPDDDRSGMMQKLKGINGVDVQEMVFTH